MLEFGGLVVVGLMMMMMMMTVRGNFRSAAAHGGAVVCGRSFRPTTT